MDMTPTTNLTDAVSVLRHLEAAIMHLRGAARLTSALGDMEVKRYTTAGLFGPQTVTDGDPHPLIDTMEDLEIFRTKMLSEYGQHLWESPDILIQIQEQVAKESKL